MTQSNDPFPGIQHVENLQGFIRRDDIVPTDKPKGFADQLVIVTSGGSSVLYIYEPESLVWRYVLLT